MSLFTRRADVLSALRPVNLYTDPAFLDVVAEVYHPGHRCRPRDYVIGGEVFRLLEVEGRGALTTQTFVDLHEPLGRLHGVGTRLRSLPRLAGVGRPLVPVDAYRQQPGWEDSAGAPTTRWDGFATWDDYLALLQTRRTVVEDLRRGRRLRELFGDLEFRGDDRAEDVLPTCFGWKSRRDLSLGRADLFAQPEHRRFFHALRERHLLRASTLRANGDLLSIWLGAVHGARWNGWVFTFNPDPALARFSPGQQLLYPMLEESYRAKHVEFDFSIGMEPYKLKFATHVRPLALAGTPAPAQRAAAAARHWLARHPWWHGRARALRRRWSPTGPETAVAMSVGKS